jgi:hypothetical protein
MESLMKKITTFILILICIISINISAQDNSFAVLELYTSEGCSSCPPAENFLKQLIDYPSLKGKNFLAVAYHVTYWDYLGWKDIYGQKTFDSRQLSHCKELGLSNRYTPMLVVNGNTVPRSNDIGNEILDSIQVSLSREGVGDVEITSTTDFPGSEGGFVPLTYKMTNVEEGSILTLLLLQSNITTQCTAGENRGKTLTHANVVRAINLKIVEELEDSAELYLPAGDYNHEDFYVAAFVRKNGSFEIIAATSGIPCQKLSSAEDIVISENKLKVFPNPAGDEISLDLPESVTNGNLTISDINGKEVLELASYHADEKIDVSALTAGVYFIRIKSGDREFTAKFSKN